MKKAVDNTTTVYAILLSWPEDSVLMLGAPVPSTSTVVTMLGYSEPFKWVTPGPQGINVTVPAISWNNLPCHAMLFTCTLYAYCVGITAYIMSSHL
jgi:hypothetical protein